MPLYTLLSKFNGETYTELMDGSRKKYVITKLPRCAALATPTDALPNQPQQSALSARCRRSRPVPAAGGADQCPLPAEQAGCGEAAVATQLWLACRRMRAVRPRAAAVSHRYLIMNIKRFTKNNFFTEKNPTIVNFPVSDYSAHTHARGARAHTHMHAHR